MALLGLTFNNMKLRTIKDDYSPA